MILLSKERPSYYQCNKRQRPIQHLVWLYMCATHCRGGCLALTRPIADNQLEQQQAENVAWRASKAQFNDCCNCFTWYTILGCNCKYQYTHCTAVFWSRSQFIWIDLLWRQTLASNIYLSRRVPELQLQQLTSQFQQSEVIHKATKGTRPAACLLCICHHSKLDN